MPGVVSQSDQEVIHLKLGPSYPMMALGWLLIVPFSAATLRIGLNYSEQVMAGAIAMFLSITGCILNILLGTIIVKVSSRVELIFIDADEYAYIRREALGLGKKVELKGKTKLLQISKRKVRGIAGFQTAYEIRMPESGNVLPLSSREYEKILKTNYLEQCSL